MVSSKLQNKDKQKLHKLSCENKKSAELVLHLVGIVIKPF